MAINVIDIALRDDFGFNHVLWVYSGRRGAHAWVCDKAARKLDDSRRRAIAAYLEVVRGSSQGGKRVNLDRPLHPHLRRSHEILKKSFAQNILENQDVFKTEKQAERLLQYLPDRQLKDAVRQKWSSTFERPSTERWKDIDEMASKSNISKTLAPKALSEWRKDVIIEYTYPRLDAEVSKHLNHLLKSPFVVHPGTGKVCVPIDPTTAEVFNPDAVPTVIQLLREIDDWKETIKTEEGSDGVKLQISDIDKTSLKPYYDYFSRFVKRLLDAEKSIRTKTEDLDY